MAQFGEQLRRERESRGIGLETISNSTKISQRYLAALENNDFHALPGGILSKGFVRGYARAVGLDENIWIQQFLAASQQNDPVVGDTEWVAFAENISRARAHGRPRSVWYRRLGSAALVLLLIAGFGWFIWHYVAQRTVAAQTAQPSVTSASVTSPPSDTSQ